MQHHPDRRLSPLPTSRWPGIEQGPATRLWPGRRFRAEPPPAVGCPFPPTRQCGPSSPTGALMHGGHGTAPGATSSTAPRKTRGRRGGVDQRPAGPTLHIARCPSHQGTHHTRRLPRPKWEFTSPHRAETSLRVVSLAGARCLKGCYGSVTPSRHRTVEEEERKRSEEPPTPGPRVGELGPFGNRGREEEGRRKGWGGGGGRGTQKGA